MSPPQADRYHNYSILEAGRTEAIISYGLKLILLASVIYAVTLEDYFIIFSAVIAVTGSILPVIILKHWRKIFPLELDIVFTAFIAVHFILGELGGFYVKYWWFDLLLHDFTGIVIGMLGFIWSYSLFYTNKIQAQPWFMMIFTVSLAMAAASIWEIFEFIMDQAFGFNMQKSGLPDTMGDLIASLLGSILVAVPGYFYLRNYQVGFIRRLIHNRSKSQN